MGTGATPKRDVQAFYEGGTVEWVTSGVVNGEYVDQASEFVTERALAETNITLYPPGTLLLAMYGEGKTRGRCSELRIPATTNQALAAIQSAASVGRYLRLLLERSYEETRKAASGGVQPNLNLSLVQAIIVPLPPLAEQHRIVAEADRRLSLIRVAEAQVAANLARAQRLRQSILQAAFRLDAEAGAGPPGLRAPAACATFFIRDLRILNMNLKPQDFLVALKLLALGDRHWTYAGLAHELGLSASEAHAAVQRGLAAGLLTDGSLARAYAPAPPAPAPAAREGRAPASARAAYAQAAPHKAAPLRTHLDSAAVVNRHNLAEFALHGAKYAFAPERLPVGPGVPTSHAAPAFAGVFADGHDPLVWPDPNGTVRGEGLLPLHPCVPGAALRDAALYELLALFDALRVGRARERGMASTRLQALIDPAPAPAGQQPSAAAKARRG